MKLSPLFSLVEDLIKEQHPLVSDPKRCTLQGLKLDTENGAYLLKPSQKPTADLKGLEQNSLSETPHIRIDKRYSGENPCLSVAHYTEIHQHDDGLVKIHVYFDLHRHLETQARFFKLKTPEQQTEFILSSDQETQLYTRARQVLPLFIDLVVEKNKRHLQAVQEAADLDGQLTTLSRSLHDLSNRSEYRRIAGLYSEKVRMINRYSDSNVHATDALVQRFVRMLDTQDSTKEQRLSDVAINTPPEQEGPGIIQSPSILQDKPAQRPKEDPRVAFKTRIETLLSSLEPLLEAPNLSAQNLLAQTDATREIKDLTLEILFATNNYGSHSNKKNSKKYNSILERSQTALDRYQARKMECLHRAFWEGDLKTFEALLDLISENDLLNAIKQWLEPSEISKAPVYSEGTIAILRFLHKKSEIYRHYESRLERLVYKHPEISLFYFFMMKLYLNDQLSLFQMFLDHGFDPNGLAESNHDHRYITLIKAITFLNKHPSNYLYVQKLLEMGACVNISHIDLEPYLDPKIRQELDSLDRTPPSESERKNMDALIKLPPFLISAKEKDYRSLKVMLPYADGFQLGLALAYLSADTNLLRRAVLFHTNHSGIKLYASQASFQKATTGLEKKDFYASILMFLAQTETETLIFDTLDAIYKAFLDQKSTAIPKSLEKLNALLEETSSFTEHDLQAIYMAKTFLTIQASTGKALSPEAVESLLSNYYTMSTKVECTKKMCLSTIMAISKAGSDSLTKRSSIIIKCAEDTMNKLELASTQPPPAQPALTSYRAASTSSGRLLPAAPEKTTPTVKPRR